MTKHLTRTPSTPPDTCDCNTKTRLVDANSHDLACLLCGVFLGQWVGAVVTLIAVEVLCRGF